MSSVASPAIEEQQSPINPPAQEKTFFEAPKPGSTTAKKKRWLLFLVLICGIFVYQPALRTPLLLDDYLHAAMVEGHFPVQRTPFTLYDFINDQDREALTEQGLLPWWSHPKLKVRFFRPLSSAVRWAEHRAFGDKPLLLHLHSLLWWLFGVLAARALFHRLLRDRAAMIATAAFALAPCHTLPLAWLANREALLSLAFGTTALYAYVRQRQESRVAFGLLAALCFALSLASGEYGVCFGGYVLAYELFVSKGSLSRRALACAPFVVPAALYLAVRRALDYGTFASGFYTDPFRETASFLMTAPRRVLTLLLSGWFSLDEDTLSPSTAFWLVSLLAVLAVAFIGLPLRRAYRALSAEQQPRLLFLLVGSFFAMAPVLAVVPSSRVLGAILIGVTPCVGMLLEHLWFPDKPEDARKAGSPMEQLSAFAGLAMGFFHLVHGPVTSMLVGRKFESSATRFMAHVDNIRDEAKALESVDLAVIRTTASAFFLPFALPIWDKPDPRWRIFAQTGHVLFLRKGPRTFDLITSPDLSLFPVTQGQLFRSVKESLRAGDVIKMPRMRVTILDVGAHGPRSARFELDQDLDDKALTWINEGARGFEPTTVPSVGFGKPFDP